MEKIEMVVTPETKKEVGRHGSETVAKLILIRNGTGGEPPQRAVRAVARRLDALCSGAVTCVRFT